MKIVSKQFGKIAGWTLAVAAMLGITRPCAAGFMIGDAANFAVLNEGSGSHNLNITSATITGNIGVGDPSGSTTETVKFGGGPINTIDGNLRFGGATTNYSGTNYTMTSGHSITGGNSNVQSDLNSLNTLSSSLGVKSGTALTISIANGAKQTVLASSGVLDGNGNRVFNVSSVNFVNGATLDIVGDVAGDSIVFNFGSNVTFGGTILLDGGLVSDQVLFNVTGTNHNLTLNTNGGTLAGTFLDANGTISMSSNSVLNGRLFGGGANDESISGTINAPQAMSVPEPSSAGVIVMACGAALLRRPRRA
jgi:hypothetical protein